LVLFSSQNIGDEAAKTMKTSNSHTHEHNFKMALSELHTNARHVSEEMAVENNKLKKEIINLQKQRRQLRALFLDLAYALEQDCTNTALHGKTVASSSLVEIIRHESMGADADGMRSNSPVAVNLGGEVDLGLSESDDNFIESDEEAPQREGGFLPPIKMTAVVSSRRRDVSPLDYYIGPTGPHDPVPVPVVPGNTPHHTTITHAHTPSTQQTEKKRGLISLTDRWQRFLLINHKSLIGAAVLSGISMAAVSEGGEKEKDRNHHKGRIPEEWKNMSGDQVRALLSALECKSIWRVVQSGVAEYVSSVFRSPEASWFDQISRNQHYSLDANPLKNGITIALPNDEGVIRHTYPSSRGGVRFADDMDSRWDRSHQVNRSNVPSDKTAHGHTDQDRHDASDCNVASTLQSTVQMFRNWLEYRRLSIHAVKYAA
jgi:hypothetical protein